MMKKTFEYDDTLPSLPLPTLEHTLARYLDSVRAVVNDEEYARTEHLVEKFAKGTGRELHEQLKNDIEKRQDRNWLARWWDEEIYLKWRLPITPTVSMMGFSCLVPPKPDSQLERTCIHMHACALVFQTIREERYPISYAGKHPLTMYQFKHFFNTCRIPRKDCDELVSRFRTVSEDPQSPPTHVVVIRNGHFFTFDLHESNRLLTPPEILQSLEKIVQLSDQYPGLGLGALTALPRDEWAEIREHLCQLDEQNQINLQTIETALMVYVFELENAENLTELAHIGLLKNPQSRWFDRSNMYIVTRDGVVATNGDHSAYEGIIPLQIGDHLQYHIDILDKIDSWPTPANQDTLRELTFRSDSRVINAIHRGINVFSQLAGDVELLVTNVHQCTKEDIKQHARVHPDTFFQLCLQLAYFKLHSHKPAPTYETGATRRFYRGRTETARTCTNEAVAWCHAMTNQSSEMERKRLFSLAAHRHLEIMYEASENQGCDRHLFGLSMIAHQSGKSFELTEDPSWIKSGGSGNFLLSTSCLGFGVTGGGTPAMCLNGYGVFYRIGADATTYVVTAYRSSSITNAKALSASIEQSLLEVKSLFLTSNL